MKSPLSGFKMKKRVGGIEEFVFEPLTEGRQLHITIAISGWLNEENPGELIIMCLCIMKEKVSSS